MKAKVFWVWKDSDTIVLAEKTPIQEGPWWYSTCPNQSEMSPAHFKAVFGWLPKKGAAPIRVHLTGKVEVL